MVELRHTGNAGLGWEHSGISQSQEAVAQEAPKSVALLGCGVEGHGLVWCVGDV